MTDDKKTPIWTKNFIGSAITNFFIFLNYFTLLTIMPVYVVENLQRSKTDAGLVVTLFLLAAILTRPLSGRIIDKYGKKRVLIVCMVFFFFSTILYIWVTNFYLLLILRFVHGVWFSIGTTAIGAIAADLVPPARRGEGLGYFAMSNNIAVVAGPLIALTLLQYTTFTWLFIVFSVLMFGGVLYSFIIEVPNVGSTQTEKRKLSFDDLFERKVITISFVASLVALTYSSVVSFISIYAQQKNLLVAASYFFLVYAAAMLISRPFVGRIFDRKGPSYVIYPSFILFTIGLITLSLTNSSFSFLFSGVLIGLGFGSLVPSITALAIQTAAKERSAHATATLFTFFDGGIALGSLLFGVVATLFGYEKLYFLASLFPLFALVLYRWMQNVKPKTNVDPVTDLKGK
ncbi:MFS transporter [Pueribacillus theae]|uniref:MFS transporter n=1 Tax=Pueribacillus theae TaxID=2171751 RepID=A0A2U1JR21_9BACI|nr:MFS transporter [Pueribacillus theae]PWA07627.1 MFS transporter [Pueribacillus theae]